MNFYKRWLLFCLLAVFLSSLHAQHFYPPTPSLTGNLTSSRTTCLRKICDGISTACFVGLPNAQDIGRSIKVTVELNNGINSTSRYYAFCIEVDVLSQIFIGGDAWDFLYNGKTAGGTPYVRLWAGRYISSTPRKFFDDAQTQYVQFYTAVLRFFVGKFQPQSTNGTTSSTSFLVKETPPISWEDSCIGGACIVGFGTDIGCIAVKTLLPADTEHKETQQQDCSRKIPIQGHSSINPQYKGVNMYVVFAGSDGMLTDFKSASQTPRKLRSLSWGSYVEDLVGTIANVAKNV